MGSSFIPRSHQTSSHYVLQNGLKLLADGVDIVQTSWTGYEHPEQARTSRIFNLLKSLEERSENVVRT